MQLITYADIRAFSETAEPFLARHEAENNLMLGLLDAGREDPAASADWEMAAVLDGGTPVLAALRTPPYNLIVAGKEVPDAALALLCGRYGGFPLPGVIGPAETAKRFADAYSRAEKVSWKVTMAETVYRLEKAADVPQPGKLRPADEKDLYFIAYWLRAFREDCFHAPAALDFEEAESRVKDGQVYLYEVEGVPVCLAASSRRMPHGRSVGPVYTPPIYRRKGYATAAAAALGRVILGQGYRYAALFADAANPASNRAYRKAGFVPVDEVAEAGFIREG